MHISVSLPEFRMRLRGGTMYQSDVELGLDTTSLLQRSIESRFVTRDRGKSGFKDIEDIALGQRDGDVFERT
jgi:hypothetical protein